MPTTVTINAVAAAVKNSNTWSGRSPALSSPGRPRAGAHFVEQVLHGPTQAVHLIEQVEDNRDPLLIDAQVLAQIANELCAGDVDVGEHEFRLGLRRNEPPGGYRLSKGFAVLGNLRKC